MQWYTPAVLGEKQQLTPEGFLICKDVPIARTGAQIYRADEVPIPASPDGFVRVMRDEEEVFRPETIASFNGKPIVNEHPPDGMVTPATWRQHSIGTMVNVRRGLGLDNNYLLADFIINDPEAIREIREGKREVSCGYDASYKTIDAGRGRQVDIIGNHVALVHHGRCGARCSIGDSQMPTSETIAARLHKAFTTKDENAFAAVMKDAGMPLPDGSAPGSAGPNTDPSNNHRIIVNVHGGAKSDMGAATPDAGTPPVPAAAPAPAAPPAAGGNSEVMQAIAALTQQVGQLCQEIREAMGAPEEGDPDAPDDDQFQTSSQNGPDPDIGANGESKIPSKENAEDESGASLNRKEAQFAKNINKAVTTGVDEGDLTKPETGMKVDGAMGKNPLDGGTGDKGDLTEATETKKVGEPLGKNPLGTNDKKAKTKDSSSLAKDFTDTLAMAELIMPGAKLPTFDAKQPHKATLDSMCALQRSVMADFAGTPMGKDVIKSIVPKGTFDAATMDCDKLGLVFASSAELMRRNRAQRMPVRVTKDNGPVKAPTLAEMNARNEEVWRKQGGLGLAM